MIKIEIPTAEIIEKQGKRGPYYKQEIYCHTVDRDGKQKRYPERATVILSKDERGNPMPYQPGMYTLSPNSIRVGQYGDIEIGFPNLVPVAAEAKKAS